MKARLTVALAVIAAASGAVADWSGYAPATLAEVKIQHANCRLVPGSDMEADVTFEAGEWKYEVTAVATGALREIAPDSREFVRRWALAVGIESENAAEFTHEVEVREDGVAYWMPIQDVLVTPFRDEIRSGTPIKLWLMLAGSTHQRWMFHINSFQRLAAASAGSTPEP